MRKRLLIVLPEGDKFDYVCTRCGSIAGDKIERPAPVEARPRRPAPPLRLPSLPRR